MSNKFKTQIEIEIEQYDNLDEEVSEKDLKAIKEAIKSDIKDMVNRNFTGYRYADHKITKIK